MATMNVSLPAALKAHVDDRVASGEYASASDYIRDLIRRDDEAKRKWAEYRRLIQEGIHSGVSDKSLDEVFDEAMARARAAGAKD